MAITIGSNNLQRMKVITIHSKAQFHNWNKVHPYLYLSRKHKIKLNDNYVGVINNEKLHTFKIDSDFTLDELVN